eukprot:6206556-Pleurochrysis_carterae.AAC.2
MATFESRSPQVINDERQGARRSIAAGRPRRSKTFQNSHQPRARLRVLSAHVHPALARRNHSHPLRDHPQSPSSPLDLQMSA